MVGCKAWQAQLNKISFWKYSAWSSFNTVLQQLLHCFLWSQKMNELKEMLLRFNPRFHQTPSSGLSEMTTWQFCSVLKKKKNKKHNHLIFHDLLRPALLFPASEQPKPTKIPRTPGKTGPCLLDTQILKGCFIYARQPQKYLTSRTQKKKHCQSEQCSEAEWSVDRCTAGSNSGHWYFTSKTKQALAKDFHQNTGSLRASTAAFSPALPGKH